MTKPSFPLSNPLAWTRLSHFALAVLMTAAQSVGFAQQPKRAEPKYIALSDTNIECSLKGAHYDGISGDDGEVIPTGGAFNEVTCALKGKQARKVPVRSTSFVNGNIDSERFGKIRIRFFQQGGFDLYFTQTQLASLRNWLKS